MTDCCGYGDEGDAETCPDCGHTCCEDCQVSSSRGRCWCKHSTRGDAIFDQSSEDARSFIRNDFGYRGPFKALLQVRMERDLMKKPYFGKNKSMKARVAECGYFFCNAPAEGWSREHPPCRTKLTDDNVSQFVLCDKCRSVAYCSAACREADATKPTRDMWETKIRTHSDRCEPYKDNDDFPYVSVKLRKYKKEFGRYPHPLGGEQPPATTKGGAKNDAAASQAAAAEEKKGKKEESQKPKKKQKV